MLDFSKLESKVEAALHELLADERRLGHRARNSDSTSIHYCEIWKLKKTFMLNLGHPNYFPELMAGQF